MSEFTIMNGRITPENPLQLGDKVVLPPSWDYKHPQIAHVTRVTPKMAEVSGLRVWRETGKIVARYNSFTRRASKEDELRDEYYCLKNRIRGKLDCEILYTTRNLEVLRQLNEVLNQAEEPRVFTAVHTS